jgi:hypothetical protein
VLLFSDPGELVFSPFAGIGSEGFMAIGGKSPKTGKRVIDPRRFYGCELKDEYHAQALVNLERAADERNKGKQNNLFDTLESDEEFDIRKHAEFGGHCGPVAKIE